MNRERILELGGQIQETGYGTEVSAYLWDIIRRPEVYQQLVDLLEAEEGHLNGRDIESMYKHSIDVANLAEASADEFELEGLEKEVFVTAALLHDVGKKDVDPAILTKPGKLDAEEFAEVKTHVVRGYEIAKMIATATLESDHRMALEIASEAILRHHYYGQDGNRYPSSDELHAFSDSEQEELVVEIAKRIGVIDFFDTLRSRRSYREPMDVDEIRELALLKYPDQTDLIEFLSSNFTGSEIK